MQRYIKRQLTGDLEKSLTHNPVTALIGPRQCGKSTLARHILERRSDSLFLDLELPSDIRKLDDPEFFFREHQEKLICIDEIQQKPDLFPILRAVVDLNRRPGRFLVLGSASRDLIRKGGESLAGRIHYLELTPFIWTELESIGKRKEWDFKKHWWRGGFPPAFLDPDEAQSAAWRRDLIQDYLSRDIPQFGYSLPAPTMRRFWQMLAHYHGGILNASKLGQAFDVSNKTVRKYLSILEETFMVRLLQPLEINLKKRLVKSPKVFLRDSGLLHTLLEIETQTDLYGHPVFGVSWEGWCLEQIISALPHWQPSFFRSSSGEEIDLIMDKRKRRLAFEFKASLSPHLTRGFPGTLEALKPEKTWVVCPMETKGYAIRPGVQIIGIRECLKNLEGYV
jgi:hypothetical protein